MTIVAHAHPFVVGVDTHARTHTFAVLVAGTGELIATEQFPATDAGIDRAIGWTARRTGGDLAPCGSSRVSPPTARAWRRR
jgi:transposase